MFCTGKCSFLVRICVHDCKVLDMVRVSERKPLGASLTFIKACWKNIPQPHVGVIYPYLYCPAVRNETYVPWIVILVIFECSSDGGGLVSPLKSHDCPVWALSNNLSGIMIHWPYENEIVRFSGLYAVLAMLLSCHVHSASYYGVSE